MANEVRLIDANVVEAALLDFRDEMCDYEPDDVFEECTYNVIMDCIRTMNAAPTIDPESLRAKGHWICDCEPHCICSVCKHWFHLFDKTNYCPNCGAKMEG